MEEAAADAPAVLVEVGRLVDAPAVLVEMGCLVDAPAVLVEVGCLVVVDLQAAQLDVGAIASEHSPLLPWPLPLPLGFSMVVVLVELEVPRPLGDPWPSKQGGRTHHALGLANHP